MGILIVPNSQTHYEFPELQRELNEFLWVTCLEQCQAHSKDWISSGDYYSFWGQKNGLIHLRL